MCVCAFIFWYFGYPTIQTILCIDVCVCMQSIVCIVCVCVCEREREREREREAETDKINLTDCTYSNKLRDQKLKRFHPRNTAAMPSGLGDVHVAGTKLAQLLWRLGSIPCPLAQHCIHTQQVRQSPQRVHHPGLTARQLQPLNRQQQQQ